MVLGGLGFCWWRETAWVSAMRFKLGGGRGHLQTSALGPRRTPGLLLCPALPQATAIAFPF